MDKLHQRFTEFSNWIKWKLTKEGMIKLEIKIRFKEFPLKVKSVQQHVKIAAYIRMGLFLWTLITSFAYSLIGE